MNEQYAYLRDTPGGPVQVAPNTILPDFWGEEWMFKRVSRMAGGSSTGRVAMARPCPDAREVGGVTPASMMGCSHTWHHGGIERREFFPFMFGLYLGDENGKEV